MQLPVFLNREKGLWRLTEHKCFSYDHSFGRNFKLLEKVFMSLEENNLIIFSFDQFDFKGSSLILFDWKQIKWKKHDRGLKTHAWILGWPR